MGFISMGTRRLVDDSVARSRSDPRLEESTSVFLANRAGETQTCNDGFAVSRELLTSSRFLEESRERARID